MKKMTLTA